MRRILFVLAILCVSLSANAQHALQLDGGAGKYGIIEGSLLPVGTTVFTLPALGGELVTTGSLGSNVWLTDGNNLTGGLPTTPDQFFGSLNPYDIVMVANGVAKLRLVSGGGVWASMSNLSVSNDLVVSNAGVLQTRTVTSLGLALGNEPFITFAADGGSLSNNRLLTAGTGMNVTITAGDNNAATVEINAQTNATLLGNGTSGNLLRLNLANANTWTGTQTFSAAGNGIVVTTNADFQGNLANSAGNLTINDVLTQTGAGQVTFSGNVDANNGLDVTGNLTVTGTSDLRTNVFNSTGVLNLNDDVSINDNLDMTGGNINNVVNLANGAGDVTVNDNLIVTGTSDLRGAINNTTGDVVVNDNLDVNNNLNVDGNTVHVGTLDQRGAINNTTGDVVVNDNLDVNTNLNVDGNTVHVGTLDQRGNIFNSTGDVTSADNIVPSVTLTYSLGTDALRWTEAYIGGTSVHIGPTGGEAGNTEMNLGYAANTGSLNINGGATEIDVTTALTDVNNNLNVDGSTVHVGTLDQRGAINNTTGDVVVNDNLDVNLNLNVDGSTVHVGTLDQRGAINNTTGDVVVNDNLDVTGSADVDVDLNVDGNTIHVGTLDQRGAINNTTGDVVVNDNLNVTGSADVDVDLNVDGNTIHVGTLDQQGAISNSTGDVVVNDNLDVNTNLNVDGNTVHVGTLDQQGTIGNSTGDVTVSDNLIVTGTSDLQGNVSNSTGILTLNDIVAVTGVLDAQSAANSLGDGTNTEQLEIQGVAGIGAYELLVTGDANITGQTQTATLVVTGTSDLQGSVSNSTGVINLLDDVSIDADLDMTSGAITNVATIDNAAGEIIVNGDLVPQNDNTFNLGSDAFRWAEAYVAGSSIHIGPTLGELNNTEMNLGYAANTGSINVDGGTTEIDVTTATTTLNTDLVVDGTISTTDPALQNRLAFINGSGVLTTIGPASPTLSTFATALTGILPVANGGTGVNASAATDGQILIGNGTGFTLNTITAGANVSITNSAGGITINAAAGTGSLITVVDKAAAESVNNSVALQADNHLFFNVDANSVYEFSGILYVINAASAVPDFKCNLQSTGNVDIKSAFTSANENNGASEGAAVLKVTAGVATNTAPFTVGNNIVTMITFKGLVRNATASTQTITLFWAQNGANASNTTIEQDSYLTYVKL